MPDFVCAVQRSLEHQPDRAAFTYLVDGEAQETSLTFYELDRRARAIAADLMERQLSGHRAMLLFPPGLDFVAALFGCLYANVVAIPAFPPRRNRNMLRLDAIAADAGATVALTIDDVLRRIGQTANDQTPLGSIEWIATDDVPDALAEEWERPFVDPDRLSVLQYTSGSTGEPKGVMLSQSNLLANCDVITTAFDAHGGTELVMSWLPSYHDMGLIGGILEPVYTGNPVVMMSPMSFLQKPLRWLTAISRYRATVSGGPNFAYDLCVKKINDHELESLDLSSWAIAFNGAEPVRARTLSTFAEKFGACGFQSTAFHPCYGMAETSLMVTGGRREEEPSSVGFDAAALDQGKVVPTDSGPSNRNRDLVGCGVVFEQHQVAIVDPESGVESDEGNIGEVWVAGPSVGAGYLNQPAVTSMTFNQHLPSHPGLEFFRTGDLGFFHDGQLFVSGRIKDMIILRGVNRYPQDIEMTVEQCDEHLRTGSVAALTVDDEQSEKLLIVAETERTSRNKNWDEVLLKIRQEVTRQHDIGPDAIVLVRAGSIPKTSSGKIQRHACRDGYLTGKLQVIASWSVKAERDENAAAEYRPATSSMQNDLLHVVFEAVRGVAKERVTELDESTNIVELGLDSLERVEIVHKIENSLQIVFSDEELLRIETCGEIAALAKEKFAKRRESSLHEIGPEDYQFDQTPEYRQLLRTRKAFSAYGYDSPYFGLHEGVCNATTTIDGKSYINFSSYNYLGMSGDPDIANAAQAAIRKYGTSVSASRLVSGQRPIHLQLEKQIASLVGVDAAIVYVGGHSTNETTIGHLFGPKDLILHDSLAHNSIIQGALLSGAERRAFPHNDWQALDTMLTEMRADFRRVLIVIEGAYSMDGDYPALPEFIAVKRRHRCFLMVDEAHSMGTMGTHGGGIGEHFNVEPSSVDIWMGTLSKSFASCGGYIAGSEALVDYLRHTAPGFVYSVGLSPPNAAAASAAISKMLRVPTRVRSCQQRSEQFLKMAKQYGLDTGASQGTPVIPVIVGNSKVALALSDRMAARGVNVQPIMHPAVEDSAARLRYFITSEHTVAQIEHTVRATAEELAILQDRPVPYPPGILTNDPDSLGDVTAKRAV